MAFMNMKKKAGASQKLTKTEEVVEITINADGTVTGDVLAGPGGEGCLDMLEELLGDFDDDGGPDKKDAFFQRIDSKNTQKIGK